MSKLSRRGFMSATTLALESAYIPMISDRSFSVMSDDNASNQGNKCIYCSNDIGVKSFIEFGGIGDGVSDNTEAWEKVVYWASLRSFSGNTPKIRVPAGRYVSFNMPNLAINRFHLEFEGEVWLINSGSNHSFTLDGGNVGDGVYGMVISGWPQIYGSKLSKHGIFARAIFNSYFQFNCRGAGQGSAGFYGEWLVDNKIQFIMSSVEGGLYSKPNLGVHLTTRNKNEDSSYNTIELKISGVYTGILIEAGLGNAIYGGSIQNCEIGMRLSIHAWDNKIWATDFESNATDFIDHSRRFQISGCDANGVGRFSGGSSGARVFGGRIEQIIIDLEARNTLISGTSFNRTKLGYVRNDSISSRFRDVFDISNDKYIDNN